MHAQVATSVDSASRWTPAISRSHLGLAFVSLLVALLFFHRLTMRDLWGSHEARAAQNAATMLRNHDWSLARMTDERLDLQKPPMYYWLAATVASMCGTEVDEWAVRLPAAIAATLTVLLVYVVLARSGRPNAAILAAIILATAQHFTWLARTARIDMPLTLCVAVAVLSICTTRRWHVAGYLAIAAGLLLKGPIGLVLPVAVILGHFVLARLSRDDSPSWRSMLWGLPLSIGLAAPWFYWANEKTRGEFFRVFFWYHNVQRAMGDSEELAVHPWWYYGPRLLVDALPWSLLIVPVLIWLLRGRWRVDRAARLGGIWLLAIVGVLSCAQFKRADYLLPAYPGLAMLLGCTGERLFAESTLFVRRASLAAFGIILLSVFGTWAWLIHIEHPRLEPQRESRTFAAKIREIAPPPAPILFFRVESHALAFHLGRPINTFLEWENLDIWAGRPGAHYVLMPPEAAAEWPGHVTSGRLEEVFRNTDFSGGQHEKPVVLMRTRPNPKEEHAASRKQTGSVPPADQHGVGDSQPGADGGAGLGGLGERSDQARASLRDSRRGRR
jgi:Dolichyl-phosphate-mannose-protein mannosyltransferase